MVNPYDPKYYKPQKVKIFQSKDRKDMVDYKFEFEITGSHLDRLLMMKAGYLNDSISDNYFILDEEGIDRIIEELSLAKRAIVNSRAAKISIEQLHKELNELLDRDLLESITLTYRKNMLPPYFSPALYKAFEVKANPKHGVTLEKDISFLEVFHMSINEEEFDKTMNYIRNYHDIPIHFVNFDIDEEIAKRKREAMRDLDKKSKSGKVGYSDKERSKYIKMMGDMGIPINVLATPDKK